MPYEIGKRAKRESLERKLEMAKGILVPLKHKYQQLSLKSRNTPRFSYYQKMTSNCEEALGLANQISSLVKVYWRRT